MAIPTYDQFIEPLLRYLAGQDEEIRPRDVYSVLAEQVGLSAEDREELLPSGLQPIYQDLVPGFLICIILRAHPSRRNVIHAPTPTTARRQLHLPIGDNYISPIRQGGLGGRSPTTSG